MGTQQLWKDAAGPWGAHLPAQDPWDGGSHTCTWTADPRSPYSPPELKTQARVQGSVEQPFMSMEGVREGLPKRSPGRAFSQALTTVHAHPASGR